MRKGLVCRLISALLLALVAAGIDGDRVVRVGNLNVDLWVRTVE